MNYSKVVSKMADELAAKARKFQEVADLLEGLDSIVNDGPLRKAVKAPKVAVKHPRKSRMSPAAKARIAAAQRKRWAAFRKAQK